MSKPLQTGPLATDLYDLNDLRDIIKILRALATDLHRFTQIFKGEELGERGKRLESKATKFCH